MFNGYYVVLKGNLKGPAVFTNYADFEKAINGYKDAEYECFDKIKDACSYLRNRKKEQKIEMTPLPINFITYNTFEFDFDTINLKYSNTICIYVSGGYNYAESKGYYSVLIKSTLDLNILRKIQLKIQHPIR